MDTVLSPDDVEQFVTRGHVLVRGCFTARAAAEYTGSLWTRLGYDENDPTTWARSSVHMPSRREIDVATFAPRAWRAACELVGGAERIGSYRWNDAFIANLWEGTDPPGEATGEPSWEPASPRSPGWHKDGDFFRHFLDSPEQGLLTLVLWSEVRHRGGATFVAADSVGPVARFLADHPEGVVPPDGVGLRFPYPDLIARCHDFVEATGEVGDVYLLHPFVLHAKSANALRRPRFITNPPLALAEPMRFDRPDPSPVERAVLGGLGVDSYAFRPTAAREEIVPQRVAQQRAMTLDEDRRLSAVHDAPTDT
jgi:hypothetical protein